MTTSHQNWSEQVERINHHSHYNLRQDQAERIMTYALEDHEGTVSIGGRTITNLCLAEDIGGLAGEEEELAKIS